MTRNFWVLVHRYAGLYMAFFLVVAGLTGSVLAFYHEIDHWLNPGQYRVPVQAGAMLDPFALRERALALVPQAQINEVSFRRETGEVYSVMFGPRTNPATGKPYQLEYNMLRLNPYTGELIEFCKEEGYWPLTRKNILTFIYDLHYKLALGEVGMWLFGIAAVIWTVDCFVGFYLTLPARRKRSAKESLNKLIPSKVRQGSPERSRKAHHERNQQLTVHFESVEGFKQRFPSTLPEGNGIRQRGFWSQWAIAWKIKWRGSVQRINFDLHRAGGLWTWVMLFVFAWSSVGFNMNQQVYQPVMHWLFAMPDFETFLGPKLPEQQPDPSLDWHAAHAIGRRLMAEQGQQTGFKILAEEWLVYDTARGVYAYTVRSDHDFIDQGGMTSIYFDAGSGALVGEDLPSGRNAGLTITYWLVSLHMAHVWGLPYRIFICCMGLVVAMLSVTGIYLWLKKRRAARMKQR
jgi:uncharacterized iron-regulated membrane protein